MESASPRGLDGLISRAVARSRTAAIGALTRRHARPPLVQVGPRIVGNLMAMARDRLSLLESTALVRGGICEMTFGPYPTYFVSTPELAHEVLVSRAEDFHKGSSFDLLRPMIGNGLLTSEGATHRAQRKLMAPAFQHSRIAGYADVMVDLATRMADGWRDGQRVDVADDMMRLTLAVVTRTLFHADIGEDAERVGAAVDLLLREVNDRLAVPMTAIPLDWPVPGNGRARRALADLRRVIHRIVGERRASAEDRGDLLSMLVATRDEAGRGMDDEQLMDEVMTLFLAGHETTANGLTWALYLLARHPEVRARLREETLAVTGGRPPTLADAPRLGLALRVFKEALRLYPPAYVTFRRAIRDATIGGFPVRRGAEVAVNVYGMHRRPDLFADPQLFDPERFSPAREREQPRGAYLPFGAGARVCIGNHFALMEGQLVLAALAQRFELELPDDREVPPEPLVTLRPRGGMPLIARAL